ncbi:hypothetical protein [Ferrimonas aestuarii]|uniref:Uncharacterized protein n=1 Tax=Ferrimonas aestuarii TaxID=2569539 RepID=A0A4U1BL17_9GAMM|nr:hypothetical protein [Ferrimonas aestuarii]TKB53361.1 hypothetical protein FCL42_14960 [Ferrimonas aestuarii]
MKPSLHWLSAVALACSLAGCGSDSDSTTPPTVTPEPPVPTLPDNVFGGPSEKEKSLYSNIRFGIAIQGKEADAHNSHTVQKASSKTSNKASGSYDSIYSDSFEWLVKPMDVNMDGVKLDSIRDDVFAEGRGSFVDILLYVADKYDLDVELEWDEELQTHWIKSINGLTGLPEAIDEEAKGQTQGGGWKMLVGQDIWEYEKDPTTGETTKFMYKEEEIYHRMDLFPAKNDMSVIFVQAQPGEMEIRRKKYRTEMQRFKDNGNKLIIPEIVIDFNPEVRAVFNDIEVKPHNLRPDLYKKDVLTELDAWLSLQDAWKDKGLNIQWSYWPKLSTRANVQGYVATAISFNGIDSQGHIINQTYTNNGVCGFVHHTGERENYHDSGKQNSLYQRVMCQNRMDMGDGWDPSQCEFHAKDYGPGERYEGHSPHGTGYMQGYTPFGGNDPHLTGDAMVLFNVEYINYLGAAFGLKKYNGVAISGCDVDAKELIDLSGVIDISEAQAPLTDSHFGWKNPDCGLCHNPDNSHVVKEMAPWKCAECHGNNGAPDSHGEVMTCGFCHAQTMERHGDAYSNRKDYLGVNTQFKEPESCLTCHFDPELH